MLYEVITNGSIEGVITDKSTSEALIGSAVVIEGTTTGALTDINGHFYIPNLKPGSYKLKVTYVSYNSAEIDNVKVQAGHRITSYNVCYTKLLRPGYFPSLPSVM